MWFDGALDVSFSVLFYKESLHTDYCKSKLVGYLDLIWFWPKIKAMFESRSYNSDNKPAEIKTKSVDVILKMTTILKKTEDLAIVF